MTLASDIRRLRRAAQDLRDELEQAFEDLGRAILSAPGRLWRWRRRRTYLRELDRNMEQVSKSFRRLLDENRRRPK